MKETIYSKNILDFPQLCDIIIRYIAMLSFGDISFDVEKIGKTI